MPDFMVYEHEEQNPRNPKWSLPAGKIAMKLIHIILEKTKRWKLVMKKGVKNRVKCIG